MMLKYSKLQCPEKMSEMTTEYLAVWCHVLLDDPRLPLAWHIATSHVLRYTGLNEEDADDKPGLIFAAIALTADMIYNPGMHVDNDKINKVVESFIALYSYNLLPRKKVEAA